MFLVAISLPGLRNSLGPKQVPTRAERRHLTAWSDVVEALEDPLQVHEVLRNFVGDNFGFRSILVRWHGIAKVIWSGVSSSEKVLLGREGWAFLDMDGTVEFLDLQSALRAAKREARVYFGVDTDWNEMGGFVPRALGAFSGEPLRSTPPVQVLGHIRTRTPGVPGPSLFMLRDSFASPLVPFLSEHFSRVHYVWPAPLAFNAKHEALIEKEAPDLVIQQFVERVLQLPIERFSRGVE